MITSVNLKPNRSNIDRLRGGAIPPYGVTTRKTRRVVGRSQVGLLLTLIRTIHQLLAACKSGASPLPILCQKWHKLNGLHNPLHILSFRHGVPYQRRRVVYPLAQWASSRHV